MADEVLPHETCSRRVQQGGQTKRSTVIVLSGKQKAALLSHSKGGLGELRGLDREGQVSTEPKQAMWKGGK